MERKFRQILLVGRAKTRKEIGPLFYSGSEVKHPGAERGVGADPVRWRVIFWFWVPPGQRNTRDFTSEVKDAQPFELQALADGTLEEVGINYAFRADMTTREATAWLRAEYDKRCVARLGVKLDETPIAVGREAERVTQERARIILP